MGKHFSRNSLRKEKKEKKKTAKAVKPHFIIETEKELSDPELWLKEPEATRLRRQILTKRAEIRALEDRVAILKEKDKYERSQYKPGHLDGITGCEVVFASRTGQAPEGCCRDRQGLIQISECGVTQGCSCGT